ncbi:class I SAM-dependent DNA methyltransferase [Deinococcus frigens]|uniref:HsdM family class I SAM-dependent methyltransferase n=1 Tax=Deinococcus frigens TaxID=249403 RepID=UPI000B0A3266|nr:N-6 DNA methylase [Deinococcus frigens]
MNENGLRKEVEIADIPLYGQAEEDIEKPTVDQLKAASSDALLFTFRRCHNYIAGNQGLQKPEAFWELLKIIFSKIKDERGDEITFYSTSKERSSLTGQIKSRERIGKLFDAVKKEYPAIFNEGENIDLDSNVLNYIVSQLQMYSLLESDVDVKGHAYEEVVGSNLRGDRGEFFTPRNICKMAVGMLNPEEDQILLDPACGTGGFLVTAMNHVIAKIYSQELEKENKRSKGNPAIDKVERLTRDRATRYASRYVYGIDFNPNLVRATKMNMVMNNDGSGGLFQANSLARPVLWTEDLRKLDLMNKVDLVFSNPPFGTKIPIDDQGILEQYDLGHIWEYDRNTDVYTKTDKLQKSQSPEVLFIERCVQFLKPGTGRAAIVLPDGILGAPGMGYVREWMLTHTRILASVDLHPFTFEPNVSIQTSVLILQRKTQEEIALEKAAQRKNNYNVFMAVADRVGHDKRGNTLYVRDDYGNEVAEEYEEDFFELNDEGKKVIGKRHGVKKILDDNTQEIVEVFRQWLSVQD